MATDERNFRSSYYEKVGFRSVEERKSLEILLKDKPLDRAKLTQFCLRFTVPGIYRSLLWKVLLGVLPVHVESHEFVMLQRKEQYQDLYQSLNVMGIATKNTPNSQLFILMWLLEIGQLKLDYASQIEEPLNQHLMAITDAILSLFPESIDAYWISKGFYQCVNKFQKGLNNLIQCTMAILEKEDGTLYSYLEEIRAFQVIPLETWFYRCFAGVLYDQALGKIWDKLAGGSCKILVYVAIVLLTTLRRSIFGSQTREDVLKHLCNEKVRQYKITHQEIQDKTWVVTM
ncbi:TBC1 domain family member 7 isoform X2 [Ischnura elegans]|uniref:TBC1 domain family member 7 isoform X2 n=1 Tax=Ischnura elegans TaxID=197161 RepID=UPI001ED87278|nr:TBC1 domain family member 7 isoform X2 [Ischnura elegans]